MLFLWTIECRVSDGVSMQHFEFPLSPNRYLATPRSSPPNLASLVFHASTTPRAQGLMMYVML